MSQNITQSTNRVRYTIGEEIANSITHGVGAALSIAGLTLLVVLAAIYGDVWRVVSFSIYGSSLILLYLASTLYHSIQHHKVKRILRIFDHAAIYLLIAGTYTPFTLVSMRGAWGWSLFGVVWGLALMGIAFKTLFIGRYEKIATAAYVLMGWLVIVAFKQMLLVVPPGGIVWLVIGGVAYTLGVIFYAWDKLPYNHAIWHLFVLAGSISHFFAILFYVLPVQQ
ncbi:FIG01964566: Predicted membrane protein, hemolysin III homolog [hydrothermal vent metagenome]|uniref:FIG01964566: Predicted membrane protein, hemolysin III homolog n=1 Tax=hydrothermal vent metagenome TaxID=652676 RepID=A0A3B0V1C8_9ZZZZ